MGGKASGRRLAQHFADAVATLGGNHQLSITDRLWTLDSAEQSPRSFSGVRARRRGCRATLAVQDLRRSRQGQEHGRPPSKRRRAAGAEGSRPLVSHPTRCRARRI